MEYEGMWLTFRELTKAHDTDELEKLAEMDEAAFDEKADTLLDQFDSPDDDSA